MQTTTTKGNVLSFAIGAAILFGGIWLTGYIFTKGSNAAK